ncbi:MAG: glycine zipper 2TM domain-containing protein [Hyphomonadaceae bacterium]|nr:glycine zipper 2TM domain-containing protein [Hyphomonadaceae bacterium]MCA8886072.1 glycine zipper 2TM domain-containing protein [Hyphomonadaceae bacterium]
MRRHLLTAAAVATALMAFAQPAAAQQYRSYHEEHVANQQCERSRQNRTVGGAVIGGVVGALLGREVAGNRGVRDEGTALGAIVGATAGGAIGRNSAQDCYGVQGEYDRYGRPVAYGQQPYYGNENERRDDDLYGGPNDNGYYRRDGRDCRMGERITRDPYGREYSEDVLMCRGRDGVWREE